MFPHPIFFIPFLSPITTSLVKRSLPAQFFSSQFYLLISRCFLCLLFVNYLIIIIIIICLQIIYPLTPTVSVHASLRSNQHRIYLTIKYCPTNCTYKCPQVHPIDRSLEGNRFYIVHLLFILLLYNIYQFYNIYELIKSLI